MSYLDDLNPAQREAVTAPDGPLMIVAGAGSGKTRVLASRISHLIDRNVPPDRILALTFTNKAAREMKERIAAFAGERSRRIWAGTFHSICARVLRTESSSLGMRRDFTIYDASDSLNAIASAIASSGRTGLEARAVRARISGAKNRLESPEDMRSAARDPVSRQAASLYEAYEGLLRRANALDFDDLLVKCVELFRRHPSVLRQYQERFAFIHVDEFQDTNRCQAVLLDMLAAGKRNICIVGDDAQSIYSFRGADTRAMADFARRYPDARTVRLEQNYRSTGAVLEAAGRLIGHNTGQIAKSLWTANDRGVPVSVVECATDRDEGRHIASAVREDVARLKLDFRDFAVLYRTNAQSRSLEDALRREAVPYAIVGGTEFYERKEVRDVIAYFRAVVNPDDDESLARIINVPPRGIGPASVKLLRSFAGRAGSTLRAALVPASESAEFSAAARAGFRALSDLLGRSATLRGTVSVSELCRTLVDGTGILASLKEEGTAEALSRRENVLELLSAVTEFSSQSPESGIESFLEHASLAGATDDWNDRANTVTLMTLHSAKGLEFPVVFLTGMEEGLLPHSASGEVPESVEEERRLCYVGMTRARKKLTLCWARSRTRFGQEARQSPSRFIAECAGESVRRIRYGENKGAGAAPSAPRPAPPAAAGFREGAVVEHDVFGRGRIVLVEGRGDGTKVVVDFLHAGRKHLMLKFAPLKAV